MGHLRDRFIVQTAEQNAMPPGKTQDTHPSDADRADRVLLDELQTSNMRVFQQLNTSSTVLFLADRTKLITDLQKARPDPKAPSSSGSKRVRHRDGRAG